MIEYMKNSLGISCVEIYFLALLKEKKMSYGRMYRESFVEIADVIADFERARCSYATYNGLRRLQDIARGDNLIDMEFGTGKLKKDYDAVLYGVRPDYKQSGFMPWRDDHYLLKYGGKYYDCYPPSEFIVQNDSIFDGRLIGMTTGPALWGIRGYDVLAEIKYRISLSKYKPAGIILTPDNLEYVRDALLIAKISRERTNEVLQDEILAEEIKEIAKLTGMIELYRQRARISGHGQIGDYKSCAERINALERLWREKI